LLWWVATVLLLALGGTFSVILLGVGLCEDSGSPGSGTYCNRHGFEASVWAAVGAWVLTVIVPIAGLLAGSRRAFVLGLVGPVVLVFLNFVLSWTLGRA
jgi:hypothetical protein